LGVGIQRANAQRSQIAASRRSGTPSDHENPTSSPDGRPDLHWLCTGCAHRREVSPRVKLRPARATELALHLDVDRGERIFKVTLEYRETETVREDYHLATGDLG
jgi:hypothetical protein